jgi:hypothetical protein
MENNSYNKIYIITLCNFWYRSYPWPNTQHIQKLATKDLWFLRYHRSRFFTFLFFLPKILGNNLEKYNKSCSSPHQESSKIEFAFFTIFYDFLEILQESAKPFYYWSSHFAPGPLDIFPPSQLYPWFAQNTPERFEGLQSYPWPWEAARLAGIQRGRAALPAGEGVGLDHVLT